MTQEQLVLTFFTVLLLVAVYGVIASRPSVLDTELEERRRWRLVKASVACILLVLLSTVAAIVSDYSRAHQVEVTNEQR